MVSAALLGLARIARLTAPRANPGAASGRAGRGSEHGVRRGAKHGARRDPPRGGRERSAAASPRLAFGVTGLALVASLGANLMFGSVMGRGVWQTLKRRQHNLPTAEERALEPHRGRLIARLPQDGGIVASFEFLSHLAGHAELHSLHHVLEGTYTFSSRPYPIPTGVTGLIANSALAGTGYANLGSGERMRELCRINRLAPAEVAGELELFLRSPSDTVETTRVASGAVERPRTIRYDQAIDFVGSAPPSPRAAAGGEVTVATYWRRLGPIDRTYMVAMSLADAAGHRIALSPRDLGPLTFPLHDWPADTTVRNVFRAILPVDAVAGRYRLAFGLGWRTGPLRSGIAIPDDPETRAHGGFVPLGEVEVEPARR